MNMKQFRKEQNRKKRDQELNNLRQGLQKISERDKSFIAGLIDGEGWISVKGNIIHSSMKKYSYPSPAFGLTSTQPEMIKYLMDILKIGTVTWHEHGKWKPQVRYGITKASELIAFLEMIIPYLKWKKAEAILVLQWLTVRWEKFKQQKGYTAKELEICHQLRKIREQNLPYPQLEKEMESYLERRKRR